MFINNFFLYYIHIYFILNEYILLNLIKLTLIINVIAFLVSLLQKALKTFSVRFLNNKDGFNKKLSKTSTRTSIGLASSSPSSDLAAIFN